MNNGSLLILFLFAFEVAPCSTHIHLAALNTHLKGKVGLLIVIKLDAGGLLF